MIKALRKAQRKLKRLCCDIREEEAIRTIKPGPVCMSVAVLQLLSHLHLARHAHDESVGASVVGPRYRRMLCVSSRVEEVGVRHEDRARTRALSLDRHIEDARINRQSCVTPGFRDICSRRQTCKLSDCGELPIEVLQSLTHGMCHASVTVALPGTHGQQWEAPIRIGWWQARCIKCSKLA